MFSACVHAYVDYAPWLWLYVAACLAFAIVGRLEVPFVAYFTFLWMMLCIVCAPGAIVHLCLHSCVDEEGPE